MDMILDEYTEDLQRIRTLLELIKSIRVLSGVVIVPSGVAADDFTLRATEVHRIASTASLDIVMLPGTLTLYLVGRFEYFVRSKFEELCDRIGDSCTSYAELPDDMKKHLVTWTAEIMTSPKKYGYSDRGFESVVITLAENLRDPTKLVKPDAHALSITTENMRPNTLGSLFSRIGFKDLWDNIGRHMPMMTFLRTRSITECQAMARQYLEELINERNNIAHPSTGLTWPDVERVEKHIDYLDTISHAISEAANMFAATPPKGST